MSTRSILNDGRYFVPNVTVKVGPYFSLSSSGTNQVNGQPLAPHPYTVTIWDYTTGTVKLTKCNTGVERQVACSPSCTFPSWKTENTAKLYGKLEEQYDLGEFNSGVFLGELGESVDMLADRVKQFGKAVRAAKKGNFHQALKALRANGGKNALNSKESLRIARRAKLKATGFRDSMTNKKKRKLPKDGQGIQDSQRVSSGWLELQYGWLPLLGDIFALSDHISNIDKPRKRRIFAQESIPGVPTGTLNTAGQYFWEGYGKQSKSIIALITEDIPSFAQALGLSDPELVAWELVPFSFVVDWFIPIGNYLQARAFASRAKGTFIITDKTRWNVRLARVSRPCPSPTSTNEWLSLGMPAFGRYVKLTRSVTSSLPAVPLPTFSNGLGKGWRLQNALALLAEIFIDRPAKGPTIGGLMSKK